MDSGGLVTQPVVHVDDEVIANIDVDLRTRPVSIDADHRPRIPIRCCSHPSYIPIQVHIFARYLLDEPVQAERDEGSDHCRGFKYSIHRTRAQTFGAIPEGKSKISMYRQLLGLLNYEQKVSSARGATRKGTLGDLDASSVSPPRHQIQTNISRMAGERKPTNEPIRCESCFQSPPGRNHSSIDIECEHVTCPCFKG